MSNAQAGTRGLSAADWTRLKRLRGARQNGYSNGSTDGLLTSTSPIYNKDISPVTPGQFVPGLNSAINVFRTSGTSKIRRTASSWTDYRASQTADYVVPYVWQNVSPSSSSNLAFIKLCDCSTNLLEVKNAGCTKCNQTTHVRIM
jgi:hypothetical protein